jgi:hypothetical protein
MAHSKGSSMDRIKVMVTRADAGSCPDCGRINVINSRKDIFLEFLEEKECWEATEEILKDRELMASIERGKEDIAKEKVRPWTSVKATSPL